MKDTEIDKLKKELNLEKERRIAAEEGLSRKNKQISELKESSIAYKNKEDLFIKENHQYFSEAFLNILDPYVVLNLEGGFMPKNKAAFKLFGISELEKEPLNIIDFVKESELDIGMQTYNNLLKKGILKDFKLCVIDKKGEERLVNVCAYVVCNDLKEPQLILCHIRDITIENQLVSNLEEERNKLKVIINNAPLGVVLYHRDKIIRVNKAFVDMMGYSKEELTSMSPFDLEVDKDNKGKQNIADLRSGKISSFNINHDFRTKSGAVIRVKTKVNSIKLDNKWFELALIEDITLEHELKQKLEGEREKLNVIVEYSSFGILLGIKGKILKANKTFTDLIGYSETELSNMDFSEFSSNYGLKESKEQIEKIRKGEIDSFSLVKSYISKFGKEIPARVRLKSIWSKELKCQYEIIIVEDISKELKAQEKLKILQLRLSTLVMKLQVGVVLEDENRDIVLTNPIFREVFNLPFTTQQLIGKPILKLIQDSRPKFADPEGFWNRCEQVIRRGKLTLSEEVILADGRVLEWDFIPVNMDKEKRGILWCFSDVTLRKKYKARYTNEKIKFSNVIENMNLGLVELNLKREIILVNRAFSRMTGFTAEEVLNKSILLLKPKDLLVTKDKEKLELNKKSTSYETIIINKNGEERHWLVSAAPKYNEVGKTIGSIGIHFDITDLKTLEKQKERLLKELEESNKGLQEYAHIVSHDLKSPLRSINALASWLQEDYEILLGNSGKKTLQLMQEKIEGMDRLIDGILKYSSIQNDALEESFINLNNTIADIKEIIYIPPHVELVISNELPTIKIDRTKIHQIFQNIISNAVEHIEKDSGVVTISSKESKTHWEFSVRDNGMGIPQEYHEKIFAIFQSLDDVNSSTGIGLSIVKKIVNLYRGKVWLESKVGSGTTFYFTIKK